MPKLPTPDEILSRVPEDVRNCFSVTRYKDGGLNGTRLSLAVLLGHESIITDMEITTYEGVGVIEHYIQQAISAINKEFWDQIKIWSDSLEDVKSSRPFSGMVVTSSVLQEIFEERMNRRLAKSDRRGILSDPKSVHPKAVAHVFHDFVADIDEDSIRDVLVAVAGASVEWIEALDRHEHNLSRSTEAPE